MAPAFPIFFADLMDFFVFRGLCGLWGVDKARARAASRTVAIFFSSIWSRFVIGDYTMELEGNLTLPDDYASVIGRIVEAWGHFELQVDLGIWKLLATPQQLSACVTSQLSSMHPRFSAFIALAQVSGASKKSIDELRKFFGDRVGGLIERRNRMAHDPRLVHKTSGEVNRLSVSARGGKISFEFVPEPIDGLKKTYNDIHGTIKAFIKLRDKIIREIEELPEESHPKFSEIVQNDP